MNEVIFNIEFCLDAVEMLREHKERPIMEYYATLWAMRQHLESALDALSANDENQLVDETFAELRCHQCGAIIDVEIRQTPRE